MYMYAFKIACWALIFIFRLRFPPGVSIATSIYLCFDNTKVATQYLFSYISNIVLFTKMELTFNSVDRIIKVRFLIPRASGKPFYLQRHKHMVTHVKHVRERYRQEIYVIND